MSYWILANAVSMHRSQLSMASGPPWCLTTAHNVQIFSTFSKLWYLPCLAHRATSESYDSKLLIKTIPAAPGQDLGRMVPKLVARCRSLASATTSIIRSPLPTPSLLVPTSLAERVNCRKWTRKWGTPNPLSQWRASTPRAVEYRSDDRTDSNKLWFLEFLTLNEAMLQQITLTEPCKSILYGHFKCIWR